MFFWILKEVIAIEIEKDPSKNIHLKYLKDVSTSKSTDNIELIKYIFLTHYF